MPLASSPRCVMMGKRLVPRPGCQTLRTHHRASYTGTLTVHRQLHMGESDCNRVQCEEQGPRSCRSPAERGGRPLARMGSRPPEAHEAVWVVQWWSLWHCGDLG